MRPSPSRRPPWLLPRATTSREPKSPGLQPAISGSTKSLAYLPESHGVDAPFTARSRYFTLVTQGDRFCITTEKNAFSPGARSVHSQSNFEAQYIV